MADGLTQTNKIDSNKEMELSLTFDGLTQTNEIASKNQKEQERDGAKPDDLTQTNEIARKTYRERQIKVVELLRQLSNGQTDGWTNGIATEKFKNYFQINIDTLI